MINEPIDDTISIKSIKECSICLNFLEDSPCKNLDCSHVFHTECIDTWFTSNNSCPLCRKVIIPLQSTINVNIIINNPQPQPQSDQRNNNFLIFAIIIILAHFINIFYNSHLIYTTNNIINNIIIYKNSTELNNHSNITNNSMSYFLLIFIYFMFFIILYLSIYNCKFPHNICSGFFFLLLVSISIFVFQSFNSDTLNYLNIESLEFDTKYKKHLNISIILCSIMYAFIIFLWFATLKHSCI